MKKRYVASDMLRILPKAILLFAFFIGSHNSYCQIIFSEPFNEVNGSTNGVDNTGGVGWTSTCATCLAGDWWEVQAGAFEGVDTNGPAVWETAAIDISSCNFVEISFDLIESGTMELCNTGCNSGDWAVFEYNIDNTGWQAPTNATFCAGGCANVNVIQSGDIAGGAMAYNSGCLGAGSTLQIRITVQCWAASEVWMVDNVTVSCSLPQDATLTPVANPFCETDFPVQLNAVDMGGTWSGTGVGPTGMFDPAAAGVGVHVIDYSVGTAPCIHSDQISITVNDCVVPCDAGWNLPGTLCSSDAPINLNPFIIGDAGGSWSGVGITGNMFDPAVGTQAITYTSPVGCDSIQTITVLPVADASWTNPGPLCEGDGIVDLNAFVTGTAGGTWSGTGVTGSNFNPAGLSGNISITYTVGTAPCDDVLSQNINIINIADASWTTPTGLCATSPPLDLNTTITGTPGGTWSGTGMAGSTFDPSVGTQSITYTVGSGSCQMVLTQFITVDAVLDPSWTSPTLCSSDAPIDLSGQITGDPGGSWSGTGITGSFFDPLVGSQSVTYTVGTGNCQQISTQTITVVDLQLTLSSSTVSCFGAGDGTATVTVVGGSGSQTYLWNPSGQTTATATNLSPGNYQVTVTDGSCIATSTVTVIEPAELTLTMSGTNGCDPQLGSAKAIAQGGTAGFAYLWTPSSQTSQTAVNLDSAMHTVLVTDANGCTATDSVLIQISPIPVIATITDTTINYPDCIELSVTGGVSYEWSPSADLDCDDCPQPTACPTYATQYCVTGTDSNGCSNTDCVLVNVDIICGEVFVPSAFSPNADGENDLECVYSDCLSSFTFSIYNRWGEKVFETSNPAICWDGTWQGEVLNSAVFVYILDGTLINGATFNQKGNISLIR